MNLIQVLDNCRLIFGINVKKKKKSFNFNDCISFCQSIKIRWRLVSIVQIIYKIRTKMKRLIDEESHVRISLVLPLPFLPSFLPKNINKVVSINFT